MFHLFVANMPPNFPYVMPQIKLARRAGLLTTEEFPGEIGMFLYNLGRPTKRLAIGSHDV